ncbi:MAG TPA: hypothetical protein VK523_08110 [Steroidobacteraceae bacterium]|nr:hypothetical protein [Steroidobacteraceae bacterium]
MRATPRVCAMLGLVIGATSQAASVLAAEILAEPPSDLIVTVYRAPYRSSGSISLNDLGGFALVTETRIVRLPAGTSRLRFEGVADGIEPASAIITGFAGGVIEKNRDARLLSPAALVAATLGKPVELLRTIRKTGKTERLAGTLLSDAGGGVVLKTEQGIEALRCSGLPETFSFEPVSGLSARPTLSVEVRSPRAETRQVTLSYLSRGFDWAADYTATLSDDGKSFDLGAWVTLANSNGVGFPSAHTQVVAGRINHEDGEVDPIDIGGPILAQCWPRGSTSDMPMVLRFERGSSIGSMKATARMPAAAPAMLESVAAKANRVTQEQLGDLKLYRVPERTTLASRQSKQVRLMDRFSIPVNTVYGADVDVEEDDAGSTPAHRLLRTKNTAANHLGLPLPSGSVAVFGAVGGQRLLEHESDLRDTAADEEVEINMGESPDVQVTANKEKVSVDRAPDMLPLVPGVSLRSVKIGAANRVAISNARAGGIEFELRLQLEAGARVVRADHALGAKNGRPIFFLHVPANETVTVRYQIQHTVDRILRTP